MTATRGRTFDRTRLRLGIVIAVICGALVFLVLQGLGGATQFYRDADAAVAERESLGSKRFRLQGVVRPDSIVEDGADVRFDVEYNCVVVPVRHSGDRPSGFQHGIPVVIEGAFVEGSPKTFAGDRVFVRHTENYQTEKSKLAEATSEERCGS